MTLGETRAWVQRTARHVERVEGSAKERTPITEGWGDHVPPAPDKRQR